MRRCIRLCTRPVLSVTKYGNTALYTHCVSVKNDFCIINAVIGYIPDLAVFPLVLTIGLKIPEYLFANNFLMFGIYDLYDFSTQFVGVSFAVRDLHQ